MGTAVLQLLGQGREIRGIQKVGVLHQPLVGSAEVLAQRNHVPSTSFALGEQNFTEFPENRGDACEEGT